MSRVLVATLLLTLGACAPRARTLPGRPAPVTLPKAELTAGHRQTRFTWSYSEGEFSAGGEGVARVAPPDSARLDLFLAGAFGGGGHTLLIGDTLFAPGSDALRRLVPAPPLLWAALGRLALPSAPDTVARVDGDTLRADIGREPVWRVSFVGARLVRLERIDRGRITERVIRGTAERVRYEHTSAHRILDLRTTDSREVPPFDPAIWTH